MKKILLLIVVAIMTIGNTFAETWKIDNNYTMTLIGTNKNGENLYACLPGAAYNYKYLQRDGVDYATSGISYLTFHILSSGSSQTLSPTKSWNRGSVSSLSSSSYTFLRVPTSGTTAYVVIDKFGNDNETQLAGTSLTMNDISSSNIIYNSTSKKYECELTWNSTKSKDVIEKYEIIRYLDGKTDGEVLKTWSFDVASGFVTNGVETGTFKDTAIPDSVQSVSYKVVATPVSKLDVLFSGGNMNVSTSTYTFPTTKIAITNVEAMRGTGVADGTYMATVNWTSSNPTNVESYSIYRKISFWWDTTKEMSLEKAEDEYNLVATVEDPYATSFTDIFTSSKFVQDLLGIKVAYKVAANYADTEGIPAESEAVVESTIDNDVPTAVENISMAEVKVYPNPASSVINISGVEVEKVEIYDIQSRLVSVAQTSTVDVSSLGAGIYFVKVNGLTPQRIIVK